MPAVSNTTPLRHLIAIEHEGLLPELFGNIVVPRAVYEELTNPKTPPKISRFMQSPPPWFSVLEAQRALANTSLLQLDRGEQEAILLAEDLRADVLLIDDQIGRAIALSRNLVISGTLGVLESADAKGWLSDFPQIITQLRQSGFFLSESLEREILLRHRGRHKSH